MRENTDANSGKPLSGLFVLDLTWVYAGPYATLLLQDLGAEVVKVEGADGDYARSFPPFRDGVSGYFYSLNRGKKSIALDLKSPAGRDLFLRLAAEADVVVENFAPGVTERLRIGYDDLKAVNPRLLYGAIHGFGSFGPYARMPAVDPVAQAMGGLMAQSGFPGGAPMKTGPAVSDALTGVYLALGLVSAVLERGQTGAGKKVEVGMMDAVFSVLEEAVVRTSMTGESLPRRGNTDPLGAPWDAFGTKDGKWVMVCAMGADMFDAAYRAIGRNDLADAYGGAAPAAAARRADDLPDLNAAAAAWIRTKTAEETLALFQGLRIPCGLVKEVAELLADPHLTARNMVVGVNHPRLGAIKTYNDPILFDGRSIGLAPGEGPMEPGLGEHAAGILRDRLGLSDAEIRAYIAKGGLIDHGVVGSA
jgi:crotonobetainyl-CoA:carnitine CoA-transferase CaiB-like acyl-CoA transferase